MRSSRDPALIVLGALALAGMALRLLTLDGQSLWYDEAVTANRVLEPSLWDTLTKVADFESHPPLWYLLSWPVTKLLGEGEGAMRLVSALAGIATVPVGYAIGRELGTRLTGFLLAALIAIQPLLFWYSQEARPYALYALLAALSFLFFARSLRTASNRDLALWGLSSALALLTHYFGAFVVGAEAAWLLYALRRRALVGVVPVAIVAIALVPGILDDEALPFNNWIAYQPLGERLGHTLGSLFEHEVRQGIGPVAIGAALLAAAVVAAAFARGEAGLRRSLGLCLGVAGAAILGALVATAAGKDFLIPRNLIAWIVPALAAVALALSSLRAMSAAVLAAILIAVPAALLGRQLTDADFQRADWRAAVAEVEELPRPVLVVGDDLSWGGLTYYLGQPDLDVPRIRTQRIAWVDAAEGRPDWVPAAFRPAGTRDLESIVVHVYEADRPRMVELPPYSEWSAGSYLLEP